MTPAHPVPLEIRAARLRGGERSGRLGTGNGVAFLDRRSSGLGLVFLGINALDGGELIEEFEDLVVAEFLAASFKRHGVGTHVQAFARPVAERSGC